MISETQLPRFVVAETDTVDVSAKMQPVREVLSLVHLPLHLHAESLASRGLALAMDMKKMNANPRSEYHSSLPWLQIAITDLAAEMRLRVDGNQPVELHHMEELEHVMAHYAAALSDAEDYKGIG